MAYSALGGADGSADDEPAFGAGGAIMEALAQSNPDIGLKQSAKKLAKKPDNSKTAIKNKSLKKKIEAKIPSE